jgi:hypothetical protein
MRVLFVVPDYFEFRPKACMNGWGSVFLAVAVAQLDPAAMQNRCRGLHFPMSPSEACPTPDITAMPSTVTVT